MIDVIEVQKAEIWRTFVFAATLPCYRLRVWEFFTRHLTSIEVIATIINDEGESRCREKQSCPNFPVAKRMQTFDAFAAAAKGNHYISESFVAVLRNRVFEDSFHFRYYTIASNRPRVGSVRLEAEGFGQGIFDMYCINEKQPCR